MPKQEWNLQALKEAFDRDIAACRTPHEKLMVKTICSKEIRERASELRAQGRLTPGGRAIAEGFGWRA